VHTHTGATGLAAAAAKVRSIYIYIGNYNLQENIVYRRQFTRSRCCEGEVPPLGRLFERCLLYFCCNTKKQTNFFFVILHF
jgi:hypothetical protein